MEPLRVAKAVHVEDIKKLAIHFDRVILVGQVNCSYEIPCCVENL